MRQAVILAAGFGSRLARQKGELKPLRQVGGSSLIQRNLLLLAAAGVKKVVIVVGHRGEELAESVAVDAAKIDLEVVFAHNPEYQKSNGLSVLAARPHIDGNFLLLMADHIFDRAIVDLAVQKGAPVAGATLCIDYKINLVFDIPDATKVVTDGQRVLEIGKELEHYNAIDTGMFMCTPDLFDALEEARENSHNDDCSLSNGVATLRTRGEMFVEDVGKALWQDVDTELTLKHAERLLRRNLFDTNLGATARAQFGAVG
ncbi:MAG: nucleotidyltransferase [Deltaproteobacteria bacterium CG_4_9_14_3_um_filter_63_12]|nr:MAG: nucleotidyltransferase [Deltaproteobacteria bacterium CG_4_9_14_3_um_filter_63_12]